MRRLVAVALSVSLLLPGCVSSADYTDFCRRNADPGQETDAEVAECARLRAAVENERRAQGWAGLLLLPVALLAAGAAYAPPVYTCSTYSRPGGGPGGYRTTTTCY